MAIAGVTEDQERRLRRRIRRLAIARRTVAVLGWLLGGIVTARLASADPNGIVGRMGGAVALIAVALLWGQLARRVDYRWFDGFCALVPVYGPLWIARIVWRLTYRIALVPTRDWPSAYIRRESWIDRVARRVRSWSS